MSVTHSVASERAVPVLHRARLEGGAIHADVPWEQVSKEVYEGKVVILKGAYSAERMLQFREQVLRFGRENSLFPEGVSASAQPDINYHRIDDGSVPSACPHILHQYGFKSIDRLEEPLRAQANEIAQTMRDVQNKVAKTNFDVSLDGLYLKVLHYPSGGGFLAEHEHPREPQGIGLITSLSRLGSDLSRGGTTFHTPYGFVDSGDVHDLGDIAIFRYDMRHAVPPIEPGKTIAWDSVVGKWSIVLELRDTYLRSHKFS